MPRLGKFTKYLSVLLVLSLAALPFAAHSQEEWDRDPKPGLLAKLIEKRMENRKKGKGSDKGFYVEGKGKSITENLNGRSFIIYLPPSLPRKGDIPLLVVLHGGFGNARHIKNYIGLDPLADKNGFAVAYLNGTQVAAKLPAKFQGWNAGGCCGQPQIRKVDDIGFITNVIGFISEKYGIDPAQVYGTGHSNGGMMTQRIMCETDLYKSGVSISATLQLDIKVCPKAEGDHIMNIFGKDDRNVPIEGGHTSVGFNKRTNYKSQAYAQEVFERSGATYDLLLLEGADHSPETINAVLWKTQNRSLPETIVSYLELDQ